MLKRESAIILRSQRPRKLYFNVSIAIMANFHPPITTWVELGIHRLHERDMISKIGCPDAIRGPVRAVDIRFPIKSSASISSSKIVTSYKNISSTVHLLASKHTDC